MASAPGFRPLKMAGGAELQFRPFEQFRCRWRRFIETVPEATLYHGEPWLQLLKAAHGIKVHVATLEEGPEILAGCLFARSSRVLGGRLVSLPDSEHCPLLARDAASGRALLDALASHPQTRAGFEIHGAAAEKPWETVQVFAHWKINLDRPIASLQKALDRDVRRNVRRTVESGVRETHGDSIDYLQRFYRLHLETRRRLGVPPRPFRYFKTLQGIFGPRGSLSVWLAVRNGADLAGLLMLHEGDTLYAKMNVRAADCPHGANHLLFTSVLTAFAGRAKTWDLGRVDIRNLGLIEFKKRLGATSTPLPYAYLPHAPRNVSAESLGGAAGLISKAWQRLPLWGTRAVGAAAYRFLV